MGLIILMSNVESKGKLSKFGKKSKPKLGIILGLGKSYQNWKVSNVIETARFTITLSGRWNEIWLPTESKCRLQ